MKKDYDKNGYIILENFFPQEKLDLVENQLHSLVEHELARAGIEVQNILNEGLIALDKKDHSIIQYLYAVFAKTDGLAAMVYDTKLRTIIKELLGLTEDQALFNFFRRCRIDPPNDNLRTYGWHQQSYYSIAESDEVQLWAPLVNRNTKKMGTMSILLGSHKKEIQHHIDPADEHREHKKLIIGDEEVTEFEEKVIELNPTDIILFHPLMVHRGNDNVSTKVRYSLVSTFVNPYDPRFRQVSLQQERAYHENRCKK